MVFLDSGKETGPLRCRVSRFLRLPRNFVLSVLLFRARYHPGIFWGKNSRVLGSLIEFPRVFLRFPKSFPVRIFTVSVLLFWASRLPWKIGRGDLSVAGNSVKQTKIGSLLDRVSRISWFSRRMFSRFWPRSHPGILVYVLRPTPS